MSYIGGGGVYSIKVILLFHLVTLYSTLVRKPTPTVMCNQNKSDSKPVIMYIYNIRRKHKVDLHNAKGVSYGRINETPCYGGEDP